MHCLIGVHNRFCSNSCAQSGDRSSFAGKTGEQNSAWTGDNASYTAIHLRLRKERGPAKECIFGCGHSRYQWAHNFDGESADLEEYVAMCTICHARFDAAIKATNTDTATRWRPGRQSGALAGREKAKECLWGCAANTYQWVHYLGEAGPHDEYVAMCRRDRNRFYAAIAMMTKEKEGRQWHPINPATSPVP